MTSSWPGTLVGVQPLLATLGAVVLAGVAWSLHVWTLRRRERALVRAVGVWMKEHPDRAEEVAEEVAEPVEPSGAPDLPGEGQRVLVVDDRPDRRDAIASALGRIGAQPAFADSPWAATVATRQAEADGVPYDLILIGPSMDGAGAGEFAV